MWAGTKRTLRRASERRLWLRRGSQWSEQRQMSSGLDRERGSEDPERDVSLVRSPLFCLQH